METSMTITATEAFAIDETETETETRAEIARRPREAHDNLLANYFRDVGTLPVLHARQEFEFAERIEALERSLWSHLLGYPQLLEPVLHLVESRVEEKIKALPHLRRSARAFRDSPVVGTRMRYDRWCERVAEKIRAADVDRDLADMILDHLARFSEGDGGTLFRDARVNPGSKAFRRFFEQAEKLGRASQRTRNEFVQANLRLVVTIARRFNYGQVPLNDLIQEGNIGLIKAVGRYDHRRGFRFSTYASWWIRHAITRAMADKGRLVRVPVHMLSTVHKVTRVTRELAAQLGRQPTPEEISTTTSLAKDKVEQILEHLPSRSLSLDTNVNDEDDRRFIDLVADDEVRSPADSIGNEQVYEHVQQIFCDLLPMEKDILRRRFGLEDGEEHTLYEIGASYDLSRERIRQIQEKALAKIRRALMRRNAV